MRPGTHNAITDVEGLRVGHASVDGGLSGTTVVLAPPGGAVGGVDVRGAAPGTRETDLLDPRTTVQRVHAIVLSGGSAYGLAAATGVMERLEAVGEGFAVPGGLVPIVPAAVVFDLGRGGDFAARPDATTGVAAYDVAAAGPVAQGVVGAGRGTVAGGLKGGVGTASTVLPDGSTVAALAVVNAVGSAVDLRTGGLYGARVGFADEFPPVEVGPDVLAALRGIARPAPPAAGTATTLAVVATDLTLDKAGCSRLATMGHDGMARALSPVHTVMDGDVVFGLSTASRPAPDLATLVGLHAAAADVVSRAIAHGMWAAESAGGLRSYREVLGI
ncbi:P1 family peptidase [Pseudonocardia sp. 73-21]|uniref:P1 family peptidase n=1 Tax=Pseudonocardia sp. 73-21 TaxID=1895809 RepID=UPI0009670E5E|nr:P1 family peptidase [Pseudonocardia sp. 73-21]OJY37496.1 MAG: hydrolase [Pseudonocardia sp. 73-21]